MRRRSGGAIRLPGPKAQGLLAYLAARPGHACARDTLAALLWTDTPAPRARHNLRQSLVQLRRALPHGVPPVLLETPHTTALNPAAVEVDTVTFETAVRAGTPIALERAAAVYRGPFLAGLRVDGDGFEEWLAGERQRLRELAREALGRLLAGHLSAGATEPAIQTALRLVVVDPADEGAHRTLMRLYASQGRGRIAAAQYQACVAALQRELGVEPETETTRLYADVVRTAAQADRVHDPGEPEVLLVGRQAELGWLRMSLDAALAGRGKVAVVTGEAGAGKTRLVAALAAEARRAGVWVMTGHAYESTRALPFGPWVEAFRAAIGDAVVRRELRASTRAELARLFPDLGDQRSGRGAVPDNPTRLFEAMARLVREIALGRPLLLAIEDLHWADEMSVRLFGFLARQLGGWPVSCVATVRDEDLPDVPVLRQVLHELDRGQGLTSIRVPALSRAETGTLVRALAPPGSEPNVLAAWTEHVWTASAGNPFVATETVRSLGRAPRDGEPSELAIPERVRRLVLGRLAKLTGTAQEVAALAATIGRPFSLGLLHRAAGLDARDCAEAVEELVRRSVLREVGDELDFVHDRVREVVYSGLLTPRRQLLHGRTGQALEAMHAGRLDGVYESLAFHYARANDAVKAVEYLRRSAGKMTRAYAHEDAVRTLREALARVDAVPAGLARERVRLDTILGIAESLYYLGRFKDSFDLLVAEAPAAAGVGDPILAGPYHFWLSHMATRLNRHEEAVRHARRALEEAERCGDDATMGKAYGVLGAEAYWAGDGLRGIEYGRQGIALLSSADERWWLGMAHFNLGLNHLLLSDFDAAIEAQAKVQAIGEALDDARLQSYGAAATGWILATRGDTGPALEWCERALARARDAVNHVYASALIGYARLEHGEPATAIPLLERAVDALGAFGARQFQCWFMAWLAEAHRAAGAVARAQELADRAYEIGREADSRYGAAWATLVRGRVARTRACGNAAMAHFTEAAAGFADIGARLELGRTHLEMAQVAGRGSASAAMYLTNAYHLFHSLGAHVYLERARAAACELGVALPSGRDAGTERSPAPARHPEAWIETGDLDES